MSLRYSHCRSTLTPVKPSDAFRSNLRAARVRRRVAQHDIAKALDIDAATYSKLEAGKRGVSLDDAIAIAATLGAPLLALLFPPDGEVELRPGQSVDGNRAYNWARGDDPLGADPNQYTTDTTPERGTLVPPGFEHLVNELFAYAEALAQSDTNEAQRYLRRARREIERQQEELDDRKAQHRGPHH